MADVEPLTGELQLQVMSAVWRLGSATVEEVRSALPPRYRAAYNTIQTVLNRLVDRGLLSRKKVVRTFQYQPRLSEDEYLSRTISNTLATASLEARQAALARLIGDLDDAELKDLRQRARELNRARRRR
jgi:BlaI family transcriptional regulator, penicillinase repressor